ncbi:MAG: dethiobiotin synthase [Gammaproteobacteria bacterium]|nr:dethiobiotin synthase [Gammaproteobacteria bacterium]MBU1646895.1 dethiobiotin synthase [Gammaproteobacteria bacterium]MBU1971156.1 dethiobiotin synthase [Gammaproteobacteria bacterium]
MKRAYFITATGTDLGKTWLTAGVAAACHARGVAVRAVKPVMSGYDAANPAASDAGVLLQKLGTPGVLCTSFGRLPSGRAGVTASEVAAIAPWRFAAPLSPDLAAAREGRAIDFAELVGWCRGEMERNDGLLLIEGVGGVMVPLDARHTVRDWIAALGLPVVLVAGSYLGALSHTLTALSALREAGVVPCAIVVNESAGSSVGVEDTVASLVPHSGDIGLIIVKRDDAAGIERLTDFLMESSE